MFDFHCHILPAIDDGSQSMEQSIRLARQCVESGVTHVVATPHAVGENLQKQIIARDAKIVELRNALKDNGITLEVIPGIEYMADGHAAASALEVPACRCGKPDYEQRPLLQELPFAISVTFAQKCLFNAQLKGVTLVLAHPERYTKFTANVPMFKELLDRGIYLQFNSDNFHSGLFSHSRFKAILELIKYMPEQILVGSDAHNPDHRPAGLEDAMKHITKSFGKSVWELISQETPAQLLGYAN